MQVFAPEVVCRKPRDELMFLFHAVCSLLDAMADRGSTGNILSSYDTCTSLLTFNIVMYF